jgi:hypothetical protein
VGNREFLCLLQVRRAAARLRRVGPDGWRGVQVVSRSLRPFWGWSRPLLRCYRGSRIGCANPACLSGLSAIGAGDTFIAGMLYGLHADAWSCREKLAFAVGLATKKVQREGFAGLVP